MRSLFDQVFGNSQSPVDWHFQDPVKDYRITSAENGDVTITVDVPGFGREDLEVLVQPGRISVDGKLSSRRLHRAFTLSSKINTDAVEASVDKGVLTLTLPVKPSAKAISVEIK